MGRFYTVLFTLLLCNNVNAQWITGKVLGESGKPAWGAYIEIKGTQRRTSTDINGNYRIEVDSSHTTLIFSHYDHKTQEINIENDSVINVTLVENEFVLEEILVMAQVLTVAVKPVLKRDTIRIKKFRIHKFKIYRFTEQIRITVVPEEGCRLIGVNKYWTQYFHSPTDCFSTLNNTGKYILDNLTYPELSACNGIQGKVVVRFKIDSEGNVGDVKIQKGVDELIDKEVVTIILSSPKLINYERERCKINDHVYFILPIKFSIR
jgi:TonB family protein